MASLVLTYSIFAANWLVNYNQGMTVVASVQDTSIQTTKPISEIREATLNNSPEDKLFKQVNQDRAEHGLKPLGKDSRLCASAQAKAKDMRQTDYFGHQSPDGTNFSEFIDRQLSYQSSAENLALINGEIDQSLGMWQSSPSHNATMLGDYDVACIAVIELAPTTYGDLTVTPVAVVEHFVKF